MYAAAAAFVAGAVLIAGGAFVSGAVTSVCGPGLCRASGAGGCVVGNETACACVSSVHGALCSECGYRGFVTPAAACACARRYFDPAAACAPVVSYATTAAVTAVSSRFTCTAFATELTGFELQPDYDAHVYGEPAPPVVDQCASAIFGPEPGAFVDSLVVGTTVAVCNTFGGPDPNAVAGQNDTSFVTCAAHGAWDPAAYRCVSPCYSGWQLEDTGQLGLGGNTVPLCTECAPWWGPDPQFASDAPPGSAAALGPFCVATYTPNNETGVMEECGGRGAFVPGSGCSCFANNGTLGVVFADFGVLQYANPAGTATVLVSVNASVATCL